MRNRVSPRVVELLSNSTEIRIIFLERIKMDPFIKKISNEVKECDKEIKEIQKMSKEEKLLDYYIIWVWGCVDPQIWGPYSTPDIQQLELNRFKEIEGEEKHIYIPFNVTKGAEIEF